MERAPRSSGNGHVVFYEHRSEPLLPRRLFIRRIVIHAALVVAFVCLSIGFGVIGFHMLGELSLIDAFLNAAMLLGGMGLVSELDTSIAKVFASLYALYAGIAFLTVAAVLLAPFAHRFLHGLHLDENGEEPTSTNGLVAGPTTRNRGPP